MTPDEIRQFNELVTKFNLASKKLDDFLNIYYRTNFIDKVIFDKSVYFNSKFYLKDGSTISLGATTGGLIGLTGEKIGFLGKTPVARQSAIISPSGGATQDSQARTAIDSIRTVLTNFGLTS